MVRLLKTSSDLQMMMMMMIIIIIAFVIKQSWGREEGFHTTDTA
jgi:hypothetical protein